ncbi:MAG: response regulator [Spirochaetes bacterium]|nr:response regulator [Spirochaetota bacterium]
MHTTTVTNKRFIILSILIFLLFNLFISCNPVIGQKKKPVSINGILDLSDWNFEKNGPVNLDGQWEFYWNRLLSPSDFAKTDNPSNPEYITLPGFWKNKKVDNINLNGNGYATYRLKVKSNPDERIKALTVYNVFSAYKLWINGELVHQKGKVDKSKDAREQFVFLYHKNISQFKLSKENEIILQILNYHNESGGIERPIELDNGIKVIKNQILINSIDMLVIGALFFMSLYNFFLYYFRKKDITPLYFCFFSLTWAVYSFNLHSTVFSDFFTNQKVPYVIDYITVILNIPLASMILKSLYPDECSSFMIRLSQISAAVFSILLIFSGFKTSEQIMIVWFILCCVYMVWAIFVFIKIIHNSKGEGLIFLVGFCGVFITSINDMLYGARIIDTVITLHYGMLFLCLAMTIIISRRFTQAFYEVEELSDDLERKNISLIKMDRIKDQFLANTSHELRTPLHGIIGISESMINGAAGNLPSTAIENLSLITSSGYQLSNLVNDLLDMARIQDKGLSLNIRPVDIYGLTELVIKLSLPLIAEKPVKIINKINPDCPPVKADEDRIKQVMHNLIGNAIKFTSEGTVEISASLISLSDKNSDDALSDKMLEIRISDTGIGVPEKYKDLIFESFQQVDGTDTRSYSGTGLGLAITKEIVESHGGTIRLISPDKNGAVFAFTLPATTDAAHEKKSDVTYRQNISSSLYDEKDQSEFPCDLSDIEFENNPTFLIVDDDPVNIKILQNYLENKKCVIKTASGGVNALDVLKKDDSIDLVLLDIMMPGMSGYEVCERIRMTRSSEDLPVIMLTAKNMISDINAAFDAGANDYIVKPFQIKELLARINTMLKLKNIRKSAAEGITLHERNNKYPLKFSDIIYITSRSKNIIIHTKERDLELPVLMKDIGCQLPPDIFMRIHKSHIININYIYNLYHVVSGRYKVRLNDDDDTELPVGQSYLESLRRRIR